MNIEYTSIKYILYAYFMLHFTYAYITRITLPVILRSTPMPYEKGCAPILRFSKESFNQRTKAQTLPTEKRSKQLKI